MFDIPAYRNSGAERLLRPFERPVHMLRLDTHSVSDESGKVSLLTNLWKPTEGFHFKYSLRLQPAMRPHEAKEAHGLGRMSLELALGDFRALHSMLLRVKGLHEKYLSGELAEKGHFKIVSVGDRFTFSTTYSLSNLFGGQVREGKLVPMERPSVNAHCTGFQVSVSFGADLINCGHFSMPDAVAGMLGFVLEAERLMCLIDGQGESELQGLQALPAKRETQPRLKLVK
ncbi:hypothetical protein [Pseudomonas aeruginosa]|uniref:hypothetical protein n=1 Tax=Pseudomonas aeruginosa TaxID=287 RepID=UPI00093EBBC2|nr:hypothetical protein [Pseudomonas aeruginosa]MBG4610148.1 hypothetical protein [Pseudomonas aeruginosa]MBG5537671.1 hypothetical protein [Pseudomonas aeruginosa]MBG5781860.1 hypothetical protein [Pseudomonas aeruginosa]MBT9112133.1 hypothetical protein [Pseudomonas aeruginosa]MBT9117874.1 hypothetical protein [Pseudomonas aeruginosa]